jgi:hypothetical protein
VEVRTCVDFLSVGSYIPADLPEQTKVDMARFARSELLTPDWMRALSMQDAVAGQSDRADHGPRGSWDGWVGLTAKALGSLGQYDAAV